MFLESHTHFRVDGQIVGSIADALWRYKAEDFEDLSDRHCVEPVCPACGSSLEPFSKNHRCTSRNCRAVIKGGLHF